MLSNAMSLCYSYRASRSLTKTGFKKTGVQIQELYPQFRVFPGGSVPLFFEEGVDLYPCFASGTVPLFCRSRRNGKTGVQPPELYPCFGEIGDCVSASKNIPQKLSKMVVFEVQNRVKINANFD